MISAFWIPRILGFISGYMIIYNHLIAACAIYAVSLSDSPERMEKIITNATNRVTENNALLPKMVLVTLLLYLIFVLMNFVARKLGPPFHYPKH